MLYATSQRQPRELPKTPERDSVVSPGSLMHCALSKYPGALSHARNFHDNYDPKNSICQGCRPNCQYPTK